MRKAQLLVSALLLFLLLVACTPKAVPVPVAPVPVPAAAPAPAPAAPAKAVWEVEWEKALEAAKKEGLVVFACAAGPEARRRLSEAFQARYGIRVEGSAASSGPLMSRVLAERRAGLYNWDVLIGGGPSQINIFKVGGGTAPLEPVLILPDVTDPEVIKKVWDGGKIHWIDQDHHVIRILFQVGLDLAINTDLVKPGEIQSWDDVLNPKWKGKLLLLDPTVPGGSYQGLLPMFYELKGEDWVRRLAAQEPVIIGDDRLALDWLVHGKYPMYTSPRGDDLLRYIEAGASIAPVITKDIMKASARAGAISLVDKAPHPNAAKVFINWVLSKEGVTILSKSYGGQSARLDVPTDFLPPYALRQPGFKYWSEDSEEIAFKVPEYAKKTKELFGHLKK